MSKQVKDHEMDNLMDAFVSLKSREEAYAFLEVLFLDYLHFL